MTKEIVCTNVIKYHWGNNYYIDSVITALNTSQILTEVYFFSKVQWGKMLKLSVIHDKLCSQCDWKDTCVIKITSLGKHLLKSSFKAALLHVPWSLLGKKEIIGNYMGKFGHLHVPMSTLTYNPMLLPSKSDFCCNSKLSMFLYSLQEKIIIIDSRCRVGFSKERWGGKSVVFDYCATLRVGWAAYSSLLLVQAYAKCL